MGHSGILGVAVRRLSAIHGFQAMLLYTVLSPPGAIHGLVLFGPVAIDYLNLTWLHHFPPSEAHIHGVFMRGSIA